MPMSEKPNQEFKSSFRFDYKGEDLGEKVKESKRKSYQNKHGNRQLEYEVAKAMVSIANSDLDMGRVWVGIKDQEGSGKPEILGLDKDFPVWNED